MRCPYCHGPVSRVRGLGKSQPEDPSRTFYRCVLCGADLVVEATTSTADTRPMGSAMPQLQLVWPRAAG